MISLVKSKFPSSRTLRGANFKGGPTIGLAFRESDLMCHQFIQTIEVSEDVFLQQLVQPEFFHCLRMNQHIRSGPRKH